MPTRLDAEVLIIGAGPTGLLLAGDLAAAGVAVTVLERRDQESNLTRAFAVHARTLELLDQRGIAEELQATGVCANGLRLFGQVHVTMNRLPSRFPHVLITPQYHTERVLEDRALRHGAAIVHDAELISLRQDADGVDVLTRDSAGDERTRRAWYVVGADGHRSSVRHALGLDFPGRSVVRSVVLADVQLRNPPEQLPALEDSSDGFVFVASFGDGWYRIIARDNSQNLPDDAPVDFADLQALARKVLRRDCGMHDPRFLSRFHSEERQARRYRVGRVFLAGDAAHVHSPAGGMGMNTGLQDAANLSWKLAAATRGRAPEGLLDSYQDERHPVGTATTRASHVLLRAALLRNPLARGVRNLLGGTLMRLPFARRRASEQVSGIGIGYDAPSGAHPLVGRRAPDLALHGGGRLYEALRHGRFVLVASDHEALDTEPAEVVAAIPATPAAEVMLVRPDGHIGWAAERPDPADVRRALARWGCAPVGQQAA